MPRRASLELSSGLLLILCCLVHLPLFAQEPHVVRIAAAAWQSGPGTPQATVRVDMGLVLVSVVPRDAKGNVVGKLSGDSALFLARGSALIFRYFSADSRKKERDATAAARRATAYLFDDVHLHLELAN